MLPFIWHLSLMSDFGAGSDVTLDLTNMDTSRKIATMLVLLEFGQLKTKYEVHLLLTSFTFHRIKQFTHNLGQFPGGQQYHLDISKHKVFTASKYHINMTAEKLIQYYVYEYLNKPKKTEVLINTIKLQPSLTFQARCCHFGQLHALRKDLHYAQTEVVGNWFEKYHIFIIICGSGSLVVKALDN